MHPFFQEIAYPCPSRQYLVTVWTEKANSTIHISTRSIRLYSTDVRPEKWHIFTFDRPTHRCTPWKWSFYQEKQKEERKKHGARHIFFICLKHKGWLVMSKLKKNHKDLSDLGATWLSWWPTYVDHIAQLAPKSNKVNNQKLALYITARRGKNHSLVAKL